MWLSLTFSGLALIISLCSLRLSYKAYKKDDSDLQLEGGNIVPTQATKFYKNMESLNSTYELKFKIINRGRRDELIKTVQIVSKTGQIKTTYPEDFLIKGKEILPKSLEFVRSDLESIGKIEVIDCKGNVYELEVEKLPKIRSIGDID